MSSLYFKNKQNKALITIFTVKLLVSFLLFHQQYSKTSYLVFKASDTESYLYPASTFLQNLETSRMPGYSIIIKIFLKCFGQYAPDALVLVQWLVACLAAFALYFLSTALLNRRAAFCITLLYVAFPYISFYDFRILTESFSNSFILISLYFVFHTSPSFCSKYRYFIASALLTLAISLKPVAFVILVWVLAYLLFRKNTLRQKAEAMLKILSFFLLFECFWIPFNYKRFGSIIPFTKTPLYAWYYDTLVTYAGHLNAAFGGKGKDDYLTNPEIDNVHFHLPYLINIRFNLPYTMNDVYTAAFNPTELARLKTQVDSCKTCFGKTNTNLPHWESEKEIRTQAFEKLKSMVASIYHEHPLIAFFWAKFNPTALFLSQDLRQQSYRQDSEFYYFETKLFTEKLLRFIWNFLYSFTIFFGLLGSLFALFSKRSELIFIGLMALSLTFIYPVVFGFSEWRYIYNALPLLIFCAGYFFLRLLSVITAKSLNPKI